jgi:hypothetical protein
MQSRAEMAKELAEVRAEIAELRRELGLPMQGPVPGVPAAAASFAGLPRTLTEEERQVQAALDLTRPQTGGSVGPPADLPPGRIKIKRQVSGIDGMRTMSPQNPARPAMVVPEADEDEEDDDDGEDWAPLTRQVSGARGMQMAAFHQ